MNLSRNIIVGISGCSSSGKTTLARLLRDIFPETFILHEDDFYLPETEIPSKDGFTDWDCPGALSIPDLEAALNHIHKTGTFPVSSSEPLTKTTQSLSHRSNHGCPMPPSPPSTPSFLPASLPLPPSPASPLTIAASPPPQPTLDSKEDQNSVGACPATPEQIARCTAKVRTWLSPGHPGSLIFPSSSSSSTSDQQQQPSSTSTPPPKTRLCLLDGFLLFSPPSHPLGRVTSLLDIKLFLRVSRERALRRREARDGYVTLEGFWKDPPGYVERIVWPNYVAEHRWLFEGGVVEGGRLDRGVLRREGVRVLGVDEDEDSDLEGVKDVDGDGGVDGKGDREDAEFGETLEWAVDVVMEELERLCLGEES